MVHSEQSPGPLSAAVAPSLLRQMNQRLLLDRLFIHGPAVRPQLARDTGLSLPTVIAALRGLEQAGLVRAAGRLEAAQGRPAAAYEADPTAGSVVGVDIGREKLRLLVTDLAGQPLSQLEVRNTARTAGALVDLVEQAVTDATTQAGLDASTVTHTVIGSPGVFDPRRGRIMYAANLPGWQRAGLAETLAERLGTALTIDNDANLAALGEHTYGAARGMSHVAYLTIGTGVGVGLVLDGRLYRGRSGAAGEIGYLPIGDATPDDHPGRPRRGMLEEAIAADAFVRHAIAEGMTGPLTAESIFVSARDGDLRAQRAVARVAQHLAQLVASILAFLDPELIVVGGGVGQNLDLLEPHIKEALVPITPMRPTMIASPLGSEAVVRGAIATGITIAREAVFNARTQSS
ncbi:ROK family transcriptional regulator [Phaeacidiphilus oryzae]|uniref:ROK family transcriptional regulator n=1 Tax=Phaeacidiphilus oryzae TaxID=348818 RepID=UPI00068A515A|nr:ROK family protein [Phaeacidiphilus oryzae]